MEIQQLRHLVAAIQCGNLLKAAEESNISQSGLSRSIKSLETRLGVPLLVRMPKGVEPTVFGLAVLQRAKVIMNEIARSTAEVKDLNLARIGEVTMGVTQNYAHYFIPGVLADLHASRPEIRVNVVTGGFLELVQHLKDGSIDFAFGLLGAIEEPDEIVIAPIREHHSRVVARKGSPLDGKGRIGAKQLAKAKWANLSGEGFQRNFVNFFHERGLPAPSQVLRTDSIALILQFVASADVLAVLPAAVAQAEVQSGALVLIDCDTPADLTEMGLITRAHSYVTPTMKQIMDRIVEAASELPAADAASANA